jgi:hypothetical protein
MADSLLYFICYILSTINYGSLSILKSTDMLANKQARDIEKDYYFCKNSVDGHG